MTAPLSQTPTAHGWQVRFFLPRNLTRDKAPVPDDDRIELTRLAPETCAVLRFSGSRSPAAVARRSAALEGAIANSNWRTVQAPAAWFYDPPWTLWFVRRNEVAVQVAERANASQP